MSTQGNKRNKQKNARRPAPKRRARIVEGKPANAKRHSKALARVEKGLKANLRGTSAPSALAYALANPTSMPNLRIRSDYQTDPTAVNQHLSIFAVDTTQPFGTYEDIIGLGSAPIMLFSDPLRARINLTTNPSRKTLRYVSDTFEATDFPNGSSTPIYPRTWKSSTDSINIGSATLISPSFFPHGEVLFLGRHSEVSGYRWTWLDRGCSLFVNASVLAGDTLTLVRLDNDTGDTSDVGAYVSATVATNLRVVMIQSRDTEKNYGYYCLRLDCADDTPGAYRQIFEMDIVGANEVVAPGLFNSNLFGDCFGHHPIPGMPEHLSTLKKARVDACSMMASPLASVLNQSGTYHGWQCQAGVDFVKQCTDAAFDSLAAAGDDRNRARRRYQDGMYTFHKPTRTDFEFHCYAGDEEKIEAYFDFTLSNINIISMRSSSPIGYFTPPAALPPSGVAITKPVYPSNVYEMTMVWSLEFVPIRDQWFEVHDAGFTSLDTIAAVDMLGLVPTFYDNPFHIADLGRLFKKGYNTLRDHRDRLAEGLSTILPMFAPAFQVGRNVLSALPRWN